ncbi:MAG: ATP-binding protein [Pseudomonadota bacterium]|nr:ATP-binding protein [Pseudomonadota bacterium]
MQAPPVTALFLEGEPGIGKSMLVEAAVAQAERAESTLTVRLDFDRPGLDVLDQLAITADVARQLADQLGANGLVLRAERLKAASSDAPSETMSRAERQIFPRALASMIGQAVQVSGRSVLLVVDTLEALRGRGETHPHMLFDWLDRLVEEKLSPLRVLAAGREGGLYSLPQRIGDHIPLKGLAGGAANSLLERLEVPPELRPEVEALAKGNPLVMRLAAGALKSSGREALKPSRRRRSSVTSAFLYRSLLSRIDDPVLRRLINPGLIVRRISAAVIREVLAPALRMGRVSEEEAKDLLRRLADQTWLFQPGRDEQGFLRQQPQMRRLLLPLLYGEGGGACARLDAAAVRWFSQQTEPWALAEAAYHQLQLMRTRATAPLVRTADAMRFSDEMIAELPLEARDLVLAARGERTSLHREGAPQSRADVSDALIGELTRLIERQDWIEGDYVVKSALAGADTNAHSPAADAIRAFWWRSGRWGRARALLRERNLLTGDDDDLADLPPLLALTRLETRAEFEPDRLRRRFRADPRLAGMAAELCEKSADEIGRRGALAFLLESSGRARPRTRAEQADPVSASWAMWSAGVDERSSDEVRWTLHEARAGLVARKAVDQDEDFSAAAVARLLAVLNPYVTPVLNLSVHPEYSWLVEAARESDRRLVEAGALLPWTGHPAPTARDHPVSGLARLGLFAEWLGALAWVRKDAELRVIARSAEAWRRTAAGQWGYGRPPRGWPAGRPIDATMRHRLELLAASPDTQGAAIRQLALWQPGEGSEADRLWDRLRRRFAHRLAAATDAEAAVRMLLDRKMPSAFAPPAAILMLSSD